MFAFLFFAAVLVLLALCWCSSMLYWYETLNNPIDRIPAPKPGVFFCLFHYCGILAGYALGIALGVANPILRRIPALQSGAPVSGGVGPGAASGTAGADGGATLPPLILIHGLYHNAGGWLYLARVLAKAGYPVSTYEYSSFSPLDVIVRDLNEHIAGVQGQADKPILIGHSLGGLLARKWLADYNGSDHENIRIRGIITLGTPHGGSKAAVFAPGALARSIQPDGSLVTFLRSLPPLPHLPCIGLVSPGDNDVLPSCGLIPPEGWKMRLTPALPHVVLLFCPKVATILLEELRAI